MRKTLNGTTRKQPGILKNSRAAATNHILHHLAFDNSLQANIITTASNGKIIAANKAASRLLGYTKKELSARSRSDIFDINESSFKIMLKQRTAEGQSRAIVTAIKKSGKLVPCAITSAIFMDEDGVVKAITTIADMSQGILVQKKIDTKNAKIVAGNIVLAKSKQKTIDIKKAKTVAGNIVLAKSKQKAIDIENKKTVASNIVLAKSKQKEIDLEKEKIVAGNIALAKSAQKAIDVEKEKIVIDNIALAKSAQKAIDVEKEKIVVDNIALAKSKQKAIDVKKEKIVADNIVLAKSKQEVIDIKKDKIVSDDILLAKDKADAKVIANNDWIKSIAKTSYDVMWDWDIATGEIYVGDSIKELFGYKVQNNTAVFKDFSRCLHPGDKVRVKNKILKSLSSRRKSWNDSFMFKRHDGSVASVVCRASIVRDEEGKAVRLIGAMQDISNLQELEKKLEKQISIHEEYKSFQPAKLSFDVIWDWNLLTNEVFMGEGFEELFGYKLKNNKGNFAEWGGHIHPDDKEVFETGLQEAIASSATHWQQAYRFIRSDGSIANVFDRASIIRHTDGAAYRMIGALKDLSRQKELEEKMDNEILSKAKLLTEYKESFELIFNSSSDVLYDCDLLINEVIISNAFEKVFGYKIIPHMTPEKDWASHIHPGDKQAVLQEYERILASDEIEWKYSYRFLRADNSVANIMGSSIILRDPTGMAYRMIGSMQDISKQKVLEERLEQEIKLKESQIAEATEDAKDTERSDIGKELHDNINQLLGVSRMYLEMAKGGGLHTEMYLSRSSEYTLSAIEELRKLTKGLTSDIIKNLGLCEAIEHIARDMMQVNPIKITYLSRSFNENSVNDKFKLNIFRIVQEQLNNILKHARASEVVISLSQNKKTIRLGISDNGIGFDTSKKRSGIGIDNIKSRATSYKGTAVIASQPGEGCSLTANFPVTSLLLARS